MAEQANIVFKVLIIGDSMVGKSSLLFRFADDQFAENLQPTIGVDCRPTFIEVKNHWIKLKIWDTAGHEKYRSITKSFYHGSHGSLVVYDITKKSTFDNVHQWIKDMRDVVGSLPIVLVGNKCDVSTAEVDESEAQNLANELNCGHYFASALNGHNVKEAFTLLCEQMMQTIRVHEIPSEKLTLRAEEESACCC